MPTTSSRTSVGGGATSLLSLRGANVQHDLVPAVLYEQAVRRNEGLTSAEGPLVCRTGEHTGRSPEDKFLVRRSTADEIDWGTVNRALDVTHFDALLADFAAAMERSDLFAQRCHACADPEFRLPIRVITEYAWHSLFARNLFTHDEGESVGTTAPWTVIDLPSLKAVPARHGTNSDVVIAVDFTRQMVLIGGTGYAGEIKKSIFTVLNYLLPFRGVLPMHCSANVGRMHDVALFFGLSGTGKTTLSSDSERRLIGDDEHGWSDGGVFNFEGGCYAKTIGLSPEAEPQIFSATRRFGTVLENVVIDEESRRIDFSDRRFTENTRAAYPLAFIDGAELSRRGPHPKNIVMLTADAFGVLPPISALTPAGAMYHFLSGYTAKVAGTERGVSEPKATFSACFGAPFLPLPATRYAAMLGEKIARHRSRVWLVNTGWSGGAYGSGIRMSIGETRAVVRAALSGALDDVPYEVDPVFNVAVPTACPDVPASVLRPRLAWQDSEAYKAQAAKLAHMFAQNFKKFESAVSADVRAAGPAV